LDTHQAFQKAFIGIKKAAGYPPSILKVIIGIYKSGGNPPSILKGFYWHKKGWWIPTKHFKRLLFA
jgi:hypothetical protein